MTTYLLTYDESDGLQVHETIGQGTPSGEPKGTVSIPDLLKGLDKYPGGGDRPKTDEEVIKTQQQINYLDCIKDGTNVVTLRQHQKTSFYNTWGSKWGKWGKII